MAEVFDFLRESSGSGGSAVAARGVMIKDRQVMPRRWTLTDGKTPRPDTIVPWRRWLELEAAGVDVSQIGVSLANDERPSVLKPYLDRICAIALHFPAWKDGRAYTQARKLRYLWGYRGVILAHGDVLRDQLLWMSRVGFDAMHMREDQDPVASLQAFSLYTSFYQY